MVAGVCTFFTGRSGRVSAVQGSALSNHANEFKDYWTALINSNNMANSLICISNQKKAHPRWFRGLPSESFWILVLEHSSSFFTPLVNVLDRQLFPRASTSVFFCYKNGENINFVYSWLHGRGAKKDISHDFGSSWIYFYGRCQCQNIRDGRIRVKT